LFGSVLVLTSQPSVSLLALQSAKPAVHAPLQVLAAQLTEAMWLPEQTSEQPPQLFASVAVLISQPSVSLLLLQSAKPAVQTPLQLPAAQLCVAMWLAEQPLPQVPQLAGSVARFFSQPSPAMPLQLPKLALQARLQVLPPQLADAFGPLAQTVPQAPQLPGSKVVLVQTPLQAERPAWQLSVQTPAVQTLPAAQTVLQPPQWVLSVCSLTQVPLQLVSPVWQLTVQTPPEQICPALQTVPQVPQLALSVCLLTQVPLQMPRPAWQVSWQVPPEQT
jgi:hypothetical protein